MCVVSIFLLKGTGTGTVFVDPDHELQMKLGAGYINKKSERLGPYQCKMMQGCHWQGSGSAQVRIMGGLLNLDPHRGFVSGPDPWDKNIQKLSIDLIYILLCVWLIDCLHRRLLCLRENWKPPVFSGTRARYQRARSTAARSAGSTQTTRTPGPLFIIIYALYVILG